MTTHTYFYVFCILFAQAQSAAILENYQAMKNETEEIKHSTKGTTTSSTPSADVLNPSEDLIDEAQFYSAGDTAAPSKPTSGPTTMDPETVMDNILTEDLKALINSGTGNINGNSEYMRRIIRVKEASTWPKSKYVEKRDVYNNFVRYNSKRLELEQNINDRLKYIFIILLPDHVPDSKCSKFYKKQAAELYFALNKKNVVKAQVLQNSLKECKSDWDDSDDCDYSLY